VVAHNIWAVTDDSLTPRAWMSSRLRNWNGSTHKK
jgi:hypothetical protein